MDYGIERMIKGLLINSLEMVVFDISKMNSFRHKVVYADSLLWIHLKGKGYKTKVPWI